MSDYYGPGIVLVTENRDKGEVRNYSPVQTEAYCGVNGEYIPFCGVKSMLIHEHIFLESEEIRTTFRSGQLWVTRK